MLALGLPSEWESRGKGDAGEERFLEEAIVSNPSLSVSSCYTVLKNASFMVNKPPKLNLQHWAAFPNFSLSLARDSGCSKGCLPHPPPLAHIWKGTQQSNPRVSRKNKERDKDPLKFF